MDLQEMRAAYAAGRLSEAIIEPCAEGNGWTVVFRQTDGALARLTDHAGADKIYHTLDHATELAKEVGFDAVRVEEPF